MCGHIEIGTEPPEKCPVCEHPQGYFEIQGRELLDSVVADATTGILDAAAPTGTCPSHSALPSHGPKAARPRFKRIAGTCRSLTDFLGRTCGHPIFAFLEKIQYKACKSSFCGVWCNRPLNAVQRGRQGNPNQRSARQAGGKRNDAGSLVARRAFSFARAAARSSRKLGRGASRTRLYALTLRRECV